MPPITGALLRKMFSTAGSILYAAGETRSIKLPRGQLLRDLYVRLNGSCNVASAVTAVPECPLGLITNLAISCDGKRYPIMSPAQDLFRWIQIVQGKVGELVPVPGGTGAALAFSAGILIPFQAIRNALPAESLFVTNRYTDVYLEITWGAASTLYTGGSATINATTAAEVYLVETTNDALPKVQLERSIHSKTVTITAAQDNFELEVPRNMLCEGILLHTIRDGVPVNDIVSLIALKSNNKFSHVEKWTWSALQGYIAQDYNHDGGASATGFITGYAYLPLTEEGSLNSALNLPSLSDFRFFLTVDPGSGTTRQLRATFIGYEGL